MRWVYLGVSPLALDQSLLEQKTNRKKETSTFTQIYKDGSIYNRDCLTPLGTKDLS